MNDGHECDPKGTTLLTSTYDKRKGWPWGQTKVPHCPYCGAVYDNGAWYDRRVEESRP